MSVCCAQCLAFFLSAYAPTLIHWPSRCSVSRFQMVVQAASHTGKPDAAVWMANWLIPLQTLTVTRPGSLLLCPLCALTFTTEQRIQLRLGKGMTRGRFLAQLGADYGASWSIHWLGTVGLFWQDLKTETSVERRFGRECVPSQAIAVINAH